MRRIFASIAALLVALLARLRIFGALPWPLPLPRPAPRKPAAKTPPNGAFPAVNVAKQQGQITLKNVTGGEHWADEIVIEGMHTIDSDLVVVAERVLKINGSIHIARRTQPGDPSIHMTFACRDGDLIIAPTGWIDMGMAAPGADQRFVQGLAQGDAGSNGGHLTLIGVNILHEGRIYGGSGGYGGRADAEEGQPRWGTRTGSAVAVGGCGGHSGDVLFRALETIKLLPWSLTIAGVGGQAGSAYAAPSHFGDGYARAGDNMPGGDIYFQAQGPGVCLVWISQTAVVTGGESTGRHAADAEVRPLGNATNTRGTGGRALAVGGNGGIGGEVRFDNNCRVDNQGRVRSGDGDHGGHAFAAGGDGASTPARGFAGGRADARGGAGAMAGAKPRYLDMQGLLAFAISGADGSGGAAESFGGRGGQADPNNPGGASGNSEAQGGPSGNGKTAAHVDKPPQPANGANGGIALRAWSDGASP